MGGFRIIPIGASGLRIEDPPTYWAGAFFVVVALFACLILGGNLLARLRPTDRSVTLDGETMRAADLGRGWKMPVFATALLLVSGFAAYSLLHTTSLVLDASTGRYTLDQGGPVVWTPLSGDLASILRATVETDNGGQRFVLVMKNGQRMGLGSFNDKGGQSEAAVAVNRFLHVEDAGQ